MLPNRTHYSLAEAAELAKCKPSDLLHYATQQHIILLTGVPDWVDVAIYDEEKNAVIQSFLLLPDLLALDQSYCFKIEVNRRTVQSDFPFGYLVESNGNLKKLFPSYGRHELTIRRTWWRTFQEDVVTHLELIQDRLFVLSSDLLKLIGPTVTEDKQRKRQAHSRPRENHENLEDEPLTASVNLFAKSSNRQTNEAVTQSRVKKSPEIDLKPQDNKPTIIRIKQVQERTGLSRSTIYERMNQKSPRHDQTFPKQVNLGLGSVGWYESEISKWIDARRK